jgi:hypothetical protein
VEYHLLGWFEERMSLAASTFLYGAVAGGVVTLLLRLLETYWIGPRLTASRAAREKLLLYSRHLYFGCGQAEFRLKHISKQMKVRKPSTINSLKLSLKDGKSLDWFTKEGYYITSTAYLIASVACWIVILQRDVVFLPFRNKPDTTNFLDLVERFKVGLSTRTILWYHYLDGIGERLILEGKDRPQPMGLSTFSEKLFTCHAFRDYYDQLFQFLNKIAAGQYLTEIEHAAETLAEMKRFLVSKHAVTEIDLRDTDVFAD